MILLRRKNRPCLIPHHQSLSGSQRLAVLLYALRVQADGVAEASNADNELFGTDRMIEALNKYADGTPEEILRGVRSEVDEFVNKAPQFDDITMLCLHFKGKK